MVGGCFFCFWYKCGCFTKCFSNEIKFDRIASEKWQDKAYKIPFVKIIIDGFMNEPLPSIIMVSSLFSTVVCLICFFVVNALEKDISDWLKILDKDKQ